MQFAKLYLALFVSLTLLGSCKPRLEEGSLLKDGPTGDVTGKFVPQSREVQRNEVQMVLEQMETFAKEKASKAISSGDAKLIDAAMAEWMSVRHQRDNLRALDPAKNQQLFAELGLTADQVRGMQEGILDSDKGKFREYKALLVEESARGNKLLDALKMNRDGTVKPSVVSELKTIMKEMGFNGKALLNPELSNAEIRKIMTDVPGAPGYLHDLPGLVDAVELREKGIISKERFAERVKANLFHNGPDAGFWKKLKGFTFQNVDLAQKLFKDTVFLDRQGQVKYPGSRSVAGILHRMVDRVSQATRGGMMKIAYEVRFLKANRFLAEIVFESPSLTIEQLKLTQQDIARAAKEGIISQRQAQTLQTKTAEAIFRVETNAKLMSTRINNAQSHAQKTVSDGSYAPERLEVRDQNNKMVFIENDGSRSGKVYLPEEILIELVERGDPLSKKLYQQTTDPKIIDKGLAAFESAAKAVEAHGNLGGDPMRPVSERPVATQNAIERAMVQSKERTRLRMQEAQAQRQARSNAANQLGKRFGNQNRQQQNRNANFQNFQRGTNFTMLQMAENFSKVPSLSEASRFRISIETQMKGNADAELKRNLQELEMKARAHEQLREQIKSGKAGPSNVSAYRRSLRTLTEIRSNVVNRIRARGVR